MVVEAMLLVMLLVLVPLLVLPLMLAVLVVKLLLRETISLKMGNMLIAMGWGGRR
jgi:hypothetical protein